MMSKYVINGSAQIGAPKDSDGHPFRLMKDEVKIFGGTWADCLRHAFEVGSSEDTLTSGSASVDKPLIAQREKHDEQRQACGLSKIEWPSTEQLFHFPRNLIKVDW